MTTLDLIDEIRRRVEVANRVVEYEKCGPNRYYEACIELNTLISLLKWIEQKD